MKLNEKLYILSGLRFIIYLSFNANSFHIFVHENQHD